MGTPLEQFEILYLFIRTFPIPTNSLLIFAIIASLVVISLAMYDFICTWIPKGFNVVVEFVFNFVRNLITENVGKEHASYFSYIFSIFTFLLVANFIGMIPYVFTVTSHLVVAFSLSFTSFVGLNIIGILKHGKNFLSLFLPNGSPIAIIPFLVGIEIISYLARMFSLAIRLFANMMSGHTLLKILSGFAWTLCWKGGLGALAVLILVGLIVTITGLELAIAFLQAYVFTILICLYISDALNLH